LSHTILSSRFYIQQPTPTATRTLSLHDALPIWLRDSVQDNTTGLLVSDEQGFIDATRRLIRDVELREELGAAAKDFALKFSWDSTGARFEELLRRLTQQ